MLEKEKKGYYEVNKIADYFNLPITVNAGNVIYNGLHWHDHIEILFCKKGEMNVRVDGETYHLFPEDFITINSGVAHEIYGGREGNLQIICSIEMTALGEMENQHLVCSTIGEEKVLIQDKFLIQEALGQMAVLSVLEVEEEQAQKIVLQKHPLKQQENWFRYHMYLYQLLMILVKYKRNSTNQNKKKKTTINECVLYIHENLNQDLSAEVLAKKMHVSQPTIYRLFFEQMGMHLGEYITAIRLNAACRYLEETTEKVIDIAYACGFTGLSNFYRIFQLHIGMTPKAYRNSHSAVFQTAMLSQPNIMKLNRFQSFCELRYKKEELLVLYKMEDIW